MSDVVLLHFWFYKPCWLDQEIKSGEFGRTLILSLYFATMFVCFVVLDKYSITQLYI
jgi:hypothetical protein